jgi:hypothetical protein
LVDPFQLKIVREHFEGTSGKPLMALGWGRNFNPPSICHCLCFSFLKNWLPEISNTLWTLEVGAFHMWTHTWNLCHRCTGARTLDAQITQIWSIESNSFHDESMVPWTLHFNAVMLCYAMQSHILHHITVYIL